MAPLMAGPDESADLSVANTALAGGVDIGDQYVPELDITYFFTKNIAAELILAVTPHDVDAVNVTVPGALTDATVDLGDVWLLPPTLTLQYHFDTGTQFTPYVGAALIFLAITVPATRYAEYLMNNPNVRIVLEGHCDERGTREYNLSLGERRAKAVERVMSLLGASSSQVELVSYGEERPVDSASNAEAWAKNRRVHFVIE